MKTFILIVSSLIIFHIQVIAHSIISFSISPVSLTSSDTITIIIENLFTSGDCDGSATLGGINGNIISAGALHCVGALTVICTDYDTVVIPPLSAGQYDFIFELNAGQGFPCTPGIVPDDIDTLSFTVDDATGIKENSTKNLFRIYPNPSNGKIILKNIFEEKSILSFYSIQGKLLISFPLDNFEPEIETTLISGVYYTVLETKNNRYFTTLIIN